MKKFFIILTLSFLATSAFGQTREVVKCRIWKTKSYCILPPAVNVPSHATYPIGVSSSSILCGELDKQNVVGVWLTIRDKDVSKLLLKNNYSNITLIRKDTEETLHPVAYLNRVGKEGNPQYLSGKSSFGGGCVYELKPKERYDIFILFETAEVGDKLIIEDFLETEIK